MIVWLASYPRSGNTFFRMLLNAACGVKTFSIYDDPLFDELGASDTVGHEKLGKRVDELASSRELYFVKTHDRPVDRHPAIYVVRDGRDALVSYAHYILDFIGERGPGARSAAGGRRAGGVRDVLRGLIEGTGQFGSWSQHVLSWTARPEPRPFTVRFEDLLQDPKLWLTRALQGCGATIAIANDLEVPAFDSLHQKWPQFFRRGTAATWRDDMSDDLHELFWRHHARAMEISGYPKGGA
jgi:hypothetical protein